MQDNFEKFLELQVNQTGLLRRIAHLEALLAADAVDARGVFRPSHVAEGWRNELAALHEEFLRNQDQLNELLDDVRRASSAERARIGNTF